MFFPSFSKRKRIVVAWLPNQNILRYSSCAYQDPLQVHLKVLNRNKIEVSSFLFLKRKEMHIYQIKGSAADHEVTLSSEGKTVFRVAYCEEIEDLVYLRLAQTWKNEPLRFRLVVAGKETSLREYLYFNSYLEFRKPMTMEDMKGIEDYNPTVKQLAFSFLMLLTRDDVCLFLSSTLPIQKFIREYDLSRPRVNDKIRVDMIRLSMYF